MKSRTKFSSRTKGKHKTLVLRELTSELETKVKKAADFNYAQNNQISTG